MSQIETLDQSDAIDIAAPLVIDPTTQSVTHVNLVSDDTHYYLGWNPDKQEWVRLLVALDTEDDPLLESALTVYDDETGDVVVGFEPDDSPTTEDILEFVWEYVEYTFPETDNLYNVMDEALDEMPAADE